MSDFNKKATSADKAFLENLKAQNDAYLKSSEGNAHKQAVWIAQQIEAKRPSIWQKWAVFPALLAAAVAVFIFVETGSPKDVSPDILTKGTELRLKIHLATGNGSRVLLPGDLLPPKARIRFEILHDQQGFSAIIGIDSANLVSVYYPVSRRNASPFTPSHGVLPDAIELDDTPGGETFYAVFSQKTFLVKNVGQRLLRKEELGADFKVAQVSLGKK